MSVLNIDLSEYDAMRSHTKELEEQVKELKEQVKGLKDGSKVILRKETVIESVCTDLPFKHYIPEENRCVPEKSRRTIETSESFVGFEDVRLKVEEHMKAEVERSIKQRNEAIARYEEKNAALYKEYKGKEDALEKEYKGKEDALEKEYKEKSDKLDKKWIDIRNGLEKRVNGSMRTVRYVQGIAEKAQKDLANSFIRKKGVEAMMSDIIHECDKCINWNE